MRQASAYLQVVKKYSVRAWKGSARYVSLLMSGIGLAGMSWSIIALLGQTKGKVEKIDLSRANRQDLLSLSQQGESATAFENTSTSSANLITASIAGGVKEPGLYSLPQGARVADLLAKSDGFSDLVDYRIVSQQLNLARVIKDQEHLYIPMLGDGSTVSESGSGASLGNSASVGGSEHIEQLNQATEVELMQISGIGKVYAARIVENKPYATWQELREKAKLSESLVNKVRENYSRTEE